MDVDPILVSLVAVWAVAYVVGRWHTTRRIAATVCSECGQVIGLTAARRREKLHIACHGGWSYTCGQCGATHIIRPPPLRRSLRE
jgi:predicted RNA-binding Zn-ribbon protein involved in translation (DUF1610 family)